MSINRIQNFPDTNNRSFYGYTIVIAAFFILMLFGGTRFAFGVFFKPVMNEFGWTRALTSGAFTLSWIVQGMTGILMGRLTDRFGPRVVMSMCGFFLGLGYLLMSQIDNLWQLYLYYGLIIGVGSSVYVPMVSTVARWFKARRSMMTGIVVAGAGLGQFIAPPVANWLIFSFEWRTSYIILGTVVLLALIVAAQFLRRDPVQLSQATYGEYKEERHGLRQKIEGSSAREALNSKQFWLLFFTFFCSGFYAWAIIIHIIPHATDLGISAANAAIILTLIGGLVIVGRIVWGIIGDRIGDNRAYIIGISISTLSLIWLALVDSGQMLYYFAPIFGFAWGVAVLGSPLVAGVFGLSAHGAIMGLANLGYNIGGALGPLVFGYLFDIFGRYQQTFLINIIVAVLGLILLLTLTRFTSKQSEKLSVVDNKYFH
jgi:MFS family permease